MTPPPDSPPSSPIAISVRPTARTSIRRVRPKSYRTKSEREVFRRDVLGLPSRLELWIARCAAEHPEPPLLASAAIPGYPLSGDFFCQDYAECNVRVSVKEVGNC